MNESVADQPIGTPQLAAYVGIDWADQKHDVVLRSAGDPAKPEHQVIKNEISALADWIAQMHKRFEAKGKVLVCLEQSRGALIYQLMAYELFELYPINPSQLANYRRTFFSSGAKDAFILLPSCKLPRSPSEDEGRRRRRGRLRQDAKHLLRRG